MKNFILASTLPIAMLFAGAVSANQTLELSGEVLEQCDITLGGQTSSSLNLTTNYQNIGQYNVICNHLGGFDVTITSANSGYLKDITDSFSAMYEIRVEGNSVNDLDIVGPEQLNPSVTRGVATFLAAYAGNDGASYDMQIRIPNSSGPFPGGIVLTDTLTFGISGL